MTTFYSFNWDRLLELHISGFDYMTHIITDTKCTSIRTHLLASYLFQQLIEIALPETTNETHQYLLHGVNKLSEEKVVEVKK